MSERPIQAGILSVGNEIVEGIVQDAHGRYLSSFLKERGIKTEKITLLPDDFYAIKTELQAMIGHFAVVFITGGLGPTSDDLTREVTAEVADKRLVFVESIWKGLEKRVKGRTIAESNRKQAFVPEGFTLLHNSKGTAPGFWGTSNGTLLFALPGPPGELKSMFENEVLPQLEQLTGVSPSDTLQASSFLIPESTLEQALLDHACGSVKWSTRAEPFRVVFTLFNDTQAELEKLFEQCREQFGGEKIRKGDILLPEHIIGLLKKEKKTVAAAESCTGGFIGKLLTDSAGSSEVFWGTLVTYANEAKQKILGVNRKTLEAHGAVSAETVREMVSGVKRISGADIALSVSGIAGPEGGTPDKPVGTVFFGIADKEDVTAYEYRFFGPREMVRRRAVVTGLLLIEEHILRKAT